MYRHKSNTKKNEKQPKVPTISTKLKCKIKDEIYFVLFFFYYFLYVWSCKKNWMKFMKKCFQNENGKILSLFPTTIDSLVISLSNYKFKSIQSPTPLNSRNFSKNISKIRGKWFILCYTLSLDDVKKTHDVKTERKNFLAT